MRAAAVFFLLVLALVACNADSAEPVQAKSSGLDRAAPAELAPDDFDPERERAIKAGAAPGELKTRVSPIDWDEADRFTRLDRESVGEKARMKLGQASIPALVPARKELLGQATVTGGAHWYAVSFDGDAHNVYVSGNNLEVVIPDLDLLKRRPDLKDDFLISRGEGIVGLSFNAFGAAYVLEVECANPSTDPRCVEDAYIVALANDLALANPGGPK